MVLSATNLPTLIPGYDCVSRLGAGGFGEVWRVAAPGGLEKAIKLVYGQIDEDRAVRELKSLERIKGVRHPFLLSLERFEIIDGRLMIVTELADGSLSDRHKECQAEGLPGIPRPELIGYLQDAADALDYMLQRHSLQHLDIKPENLLIVGGHTKVADFGLVKEVVERTVSLVGGLTPFYASPETFSGTPSRQSDQYSLAVVYQELLTGKLPFVGKTPAQMAMMHAQGCPHLSPLPAEDRAIVGRALAKDPGGRFASCSEFVRALIGLPSERSSSASEPVDAIAVRSDATDVGDTDKTVPETKSSPLLSDSNRHGGSNTEILRTEVLDNAEGKGDSARFARPDDEKRPVIKVSQSVGRLDALSPDDLSAGLRPMLFLGVGGLGTEVVRRLKGRIDQWHSGGANDAFQYLVLDTDRQAIEAGGPHEKEGRIPFEDRLCLPLRKTNDYKNSSTDWLEWLSRRWLYNIPRSLRTQGFRPLGRLALVDHWKSVIAAIRSRIEELQKPRVAELLRDVTGHDCRDATPLVFVIGSVSGGTGGGMVLDIGAATRRLLCEAKIEQPAVHGVLLHATSRQPTQSALATANAYATLCELYHLTRCGDGELAADHSAIDTMNGVLAPFDESNFIILGEETGDDQIYRQIGQVVDYLVCQTASPLGGMSVDDGADQDATINDLDVELRSFAARRVVTDDSDLAERVAEAVLLEVAQRWLALSSQPLLEPKVASTSTPRGLDEAAHQNQATLEPSAEQDGPDDTEWILERGVYEFADLASSQFASSTCRFLLQRVQAIDKQDASKRGEFEQRAMIMLAFAVKQLKQIRTLPEAEPQAAAEISKASFGWTDQLTELIPVLADRVADVVWKEYVQQFDPAAPKTATDGEEVRLESLIDRVRSVAESQAVDVIRELAPDGSVDVHGRLVPDQESLDRALDKVNLPVHDGGHLFRDSVILPKSCERSAASDQLQGALSARATVFAGNAEEGTFVVRMAGRLSLAQTAKSLIGEKHDLLEAARRLHARKDVEWQYPPEVEADEDA